MPYVMRLPTFTGGDGGDQGGGGSPTELFLNHWNGTNGSTTFVDEVPGNTWTATGTPTLDTSAPKFGASAVGSTSSGTLRVTGFTAIDALSWTLETFATSRGQNSTVGLAMISTTTSAEATMNLLIATNQLQCYALNAAGSIEFQDIVAFDGSVPKADYVHMAITYQFSTGIFSYYYDGDLITQSTSISNAGKNLDRGHVGANDDFFFDETRLVDSVVYTGATYAVPSGEF